MVNGMTSFKQFLNLLRFSHWSKAAFVLLGVLYSGTFEKLPIALLAALSFCLIASAVYIYNDIQDQEEDRLHPHKCQRPLAGGVITLDFAVSMLALLLISGLVLAWSISSTLAALLGMYLLINLAYNHFFKNLPVFDVLCLTSGFILRVMAGTIGIGLPLSRWLLLTATFVSILIALCKRRLEKQLDSNNFETSLAATSYSPKTLDNLIAITATFSFFIYLLYTVVVRNQTFYFLLTLPFAAIGLWRFVWLTTRVSSIDDPVSLFFNDNLSRLNLLCFLLLTLVALVN